MGFLVEKTLLSACGRSVSLGIVYPLTISTDHFMSPLCLGLTEAERVVLTGGNLQPPSFFFGDVVVRLEMRFTAGFKSVLIRDIITIHKATHSTEDNALSKDQTFHIIVV